MVLFEKLKVDIAHVARLERPYHPQEDVEITRPFPDDSGYLSGVGRDYESVGSGISVDYGVGQWGEVFWFAPHEPQETSGKGCTFCGRGL